MIKRWDEAEEPELFKAVELGDLERVEHLLDDGANANAVDRTPLFGSGNSVLHDAVAVGRPDIVRVLIHAGADVDAVCDRQWTPLMRACNAGFQDIALMLLNAGADIHARNDEGYSALGRVPGDRAELIALLETWGATV